jgi:hypothetical protein
LGYLPQVGTMNLGKHWQQLWMGSFVLIVILRP